MRTTGVVVCFAALVCVPVVAQADEKVLAYRDTWEKHFTITSNTKPYTYDMVARKVGECYNHEAGLLWKLEHRVSGTWVDYNYCLLTRECEFSSPSQPGYYRIWVGNPSSCAFRVTITTHH